MLLLLLHYLKISSSLVLNPTDYSLWSELMNIFSIKPQQNTECLRQALLKVAANFAMKAVHNAVHYWLDDMVTWQRDKFCELFFFSMKKLKKKNGKIQHRKRKKMQVGMHEKLHTKVMGGGGGMRHHSKWT